MTPFLTSSRLDLRALQREDLRGPVRNWTDDKEVTHYLLRGAFPGCIEEFERQYDGQVESKTEIQLLIVDRASDKPIGLTGLYVIEWISRAAEVRILIGEKDFWGKGYGGEATQLLVAYAFENLNLNKVYLGVNKENIGAVKSYEKVGFVREGELREEVYRNGRYYNVLRMSLLRNEYALVKPGWATSADIDRQLRSKA